MSWSKWNGTVVDDAAFIFLLVLVFALGYMIGDI